MKNVSAIEYYNKKAQNGYDKEYNTPYWQVEFQISIQHIATFIKPKMKILDIGAGSGKYSQTISQHDVVMCAIEPAPLMISTFKQRNPHIPVIQATIENIPKENNSFDMVIAMGDVLSYAENTEQALREVYRILKPKGIFIASVDNFYYFLTDIMKYGTYQDIINFQKSHVAPVGNTNFYFFSKTFKPEELTQIANQYEFEHIDMIFKLAAFSEQDKIENINKAISIEWSLNRNFYFIGNAQHIQFVWKKKG